jgi:hypothetical protein
MSPDAHEQAAVPVVHPIPRRYVALGLIVLAVILLAVLIVIRDNGGQSPTATAETFTPAPSSLVDPLTRLPASTIDAVGVTSAAGAITPPTPTRSPSLWQGSTHGVVALPVVFFYGSEFSPYAAAERWSLIVALSRFGSFGSNSLGLMQSSSTTAFADTATFTFSNTTYRSIWLNLQTVERYSTLNPTGATYSTLQAPSAREAASVATYDGSGPTFPLLDIANHYVLVGSGFSPSILAGLSQSQIVTDLGYPTNPVTQAVVSSANEITAAICSVTGQRPTAACSAHGVTVADVKMGIVPTG